jgi:histidyl-tRNA synthetase
MNKEQLQPLSGFRDNRGSEKYQVMEKLRTTFESFGYEGLETPSLEKQELLLNKYGPDAQKLLYLFEDNGQRKIGLRYDLTLPLSRFVASNYEQLPLPYKRYEIGNAWRAERPQKGRLRQFTQADIDIIGCDCVGAEREIVQVLKAVGEKLNLNITILINDRRIIGQVFEKLKISQDEQRQTIRLLDKKDKITQERFEEELKNLSLSDVQRRQITAIFLTDEEASIEAIRQVLKDSDIFNRVIELVAWANKYGLKARYCANMVRGLDYYTGTIFECVADNYPSTLIAGGRYDDLVESLIGKKTPAVGISFGVDRIVDALTNKEQIPGLFMANIPQTASQIQSWADELRRSGKIVEVYLDEKDELGKQIKYAVKRGYSKIVIPFEDEWETGKVIVKDLLTGDQRPVKREELSS